MFCLPRLFYILARVCLPRLFYIFQLCPQGLCLGLGIHGCAASFIVLRFRLFVCLLHLRQDAALVGQLCLRLVPVLKWESFRQFLQLAVQALLEFLGFYEKLLGILPFLPGILLPY